MVDQLKQLERAVEQSLADGDTKPLDESIDEFLNENEEISVSASTRLSDFLLRTWLSLVGRRPSLTERESTISPVSTNTVEIQPVSSSDHNIGTMALFMDTLIRLGPCLINKTDLRHWWRELSPLAIDSSGHPLDLVDKAQKFISGVLTSSFYIYAEASQLDHLTDLAAFYGQNVLDAYAHKWLPGASDDTHISDERRRFLLVNCRKMLVEYARKHTKIAFTQLNHYFTDPQSRLDILDWVVEYVSESQNSKLFLVFETPFFESLMVCLERDTSRVVLQLALTSLSMIMVHICDKLVSTGILFRIYGVFGRACSWQPQVLELDDSDTETEPAVDGWVPLRNDKEEVFAVDGEEDSDEISVKVICLFTMLYGLFPINTLSFCRQCDDYFKKHSYERRFADFWSRFMVMRKAERLVKQFRVDPGLLLSSEELELTESVQRFQEAGSVLGLTSICTSRRVIEEDSDDSHTDNEAKVLVENFEQKMAKSADVSMSPEPESQVLQSPKAFDKRLEDHKRAFEMHASDTVSHFRREFLLIGTELAFANFSRDMSEQRALRWQKRAARAMILLSQNEVLKRDNASLRSMATQLRDEVARAVRSARNIMRERSAYETKILDRNREFRDKVKTLEETIFDLQLQAETFRFERDVANQQALEARDELVQIEERFNLYKSDVEAAGRPTELASAGSDMLADDIKEKELEVQALQERLNALEWAMKRLEEDQAEDVRKLKREVEVAQNNFAQVKNEEDRKLRERSRTSEADAAAQAEAKEQRRILKQQNEELSRRCAALEHELRNRKVHEEERLNELHAAILASRPHTVRTTENRFRGRGGAQGVFNPR